jgi:hypothetical protein
VILAVSFAGWLRRLKVCASCAEGWKLATAGKANDVGSGEVVCDRDAFDFGLHAFIHADQDGLGERLFFVS